MANKKTKIGIIAGNRKLPVLLAKRIKESRPRPEITAVCLRGETSSLIRRYADKCLWARASRLKELRRAVIGSGVKEWVMAGQVNPLNIFRPEKWDDELKKLIGSTENFCPHIIFQAIIAYLEKEGVSFLDSTFYLKENLAKEGMINGLKVCGTARQDIDFGRDKISKFVELDIGQTMVVRNNAVVAIESLEGTDNTIKRGFKLAGRGLTVLKFAKHGQDLRFDVPVVGISTLRLLKKTGAAVLVLHAGKTIILEKDRFLSLSRKWKIPVIGRQPG